MSLSLHQKPVNSTLKLPVITNWTPLIGYMLFKDANISSLFYYKLIMEVWKGTVTVFDGSQGTLIAKMKQRRNGYSDDIANNKARAFFDIGKIVNTQLVDTENDQNQDGLPFESIHRLGANTGVLDKIFSHNGDRDTGKTQLSSITVRGYQESSSSASASPTEDTSGAVSETLYYIQASLPITTARSFISTSSSYDSTYIQGDQFKDFQHDDTDAKFLSDVETQFSVEAGVRRYIRLQSSDYHTIAFLNGTSDLECNVGFIAVKFFESDGTLISTSFFSNQAVNGGFNASANTDTTVTPSITKEDKHRLIYFGCGLANLEAQTLITNAKPSNNTNYAYYTVQAVSNVLSAKSQVYYFIKSDGSCKNYKVRRLAFRNSLGAYDYFNFSLKSTQTINVTKDTFGSMLGVFNKSKYRYDNSQRGKTVRQTKAVLKETLNTDYITEADANLLEKLIMTQNVFVVENADTSTTEPVIITSSSHIRKTIVNDSLIQYTIEIEYANERNTNS